MVDFPYRTVTIGSFEWDREKETINVERHGVAFSDAVEAFLDPHRLIVKDSKHGTGEIRYFCVGLVQGRIATVRFTLRNERIRIIGAGYWRKWRRWYEEKKELR